MTGSSFQTYVGPISNPYQTSSAVLDFGWPDIANQISHMQVTDAPNPPNSPRHDVRLLILPLLIFLSMCLFVLLLVIACLALFRHRRGVMINHFSGPVDLGREEFVNGEGGFEGLEFRWLESAIESVRRSYLKAKVYQLQHPPNSHPTDITLSQFLYIQEKGVSAWCFEPDCDTINYLLVHARTEITFLPDPASSSCVQSNLPLPKLNDVYYWEVKMFDLPESTAVAIGLATKPYPTFRLPGVNRYSVAYHSNGDKSYNYPFNTSSFGPTLREGDVLGVGYRPRTGIIFFTRNGRKLEDAFVGFSKWNLFPTIGADGPCSVHVNFGQAGFVFIEANVKKWGLAPCAGTLAPPPAYGSERGSILLDVGRELHASISNTPSELPTTTRFLQQMRRPKRGTHIAPAWHIRSNMDLTSTSTASPTTAFGDGVGQVVSTPNRVVSLSSADTRPIVQEGDFVYPESESSRRMLLSGTDEASQACNMPHPMNPASNRDIQLLSLSTVSPQEADRQSGDVNFFGTSTRGNPPAYSTLNISEPT